MQLKEEAPDRKFWTEYDYFEFEKQARALRRAEVYALVRKLWQRGSKLMQRMIASLANAGAQPSSSPRRARSRSCS